MLMRGTSTQCFASGYLSFFFTDCLMSRWYVRLRRDATLGTIKTEGQANDHRLINYTPQATMVRLLTINACNAYLTAGVLSLAGGFRDPRLLLPGWIGIATVRPWPSPLSSLLSPLTCPMCVLCPRQANPVSPPRP